MESYTIKERNTFKQEEAAVWEAKRRGKISNYTNRTILDWDSWTIKQAKKNQNKAKTTTRKTIASANGDGQTEPVPRVSVYILVR